MEGILSSCSTLGGLTYVKRTVMAAVRGGRPDPRKSHESVIVSMTFNAQPARSIDRNYVSFINIRLKRSNSRRCPLCLLGGDEIH